MQYSFALTVQTFGKWFQAIPRLFVCLFGSLVYSVLAAVSRGQYDSTVSLFLNLLAYWSVPSPPAFGLRSRQRCRLAPYAVILGLEHIFFRKATWSNYELDQVHKARVLPPGIAALLSLVVGFVGALLGMNQTWVCASPRRFLPALTEGRGAVAGTPFSARGRHWSRARSSLQCRGAPTIPSRCSTFFLTRSPSHTPLCVSPSWRGSVGEDQSL